MTSLVAFDTWLTFAFKGALVIAAALAVTRLLKDRTAALRYLVLAAALSAVVVLPLAAHLVPPVPVALASWQAAHEAVALQPVAAEHATAARDRQPRARSTSGEIAATQVPPRPVSPPFGSTGLVLFVWLTGSMLLLARMLWGLVASQRVVAASWPLADDTWVIRLESAALELGCRRAVRLLASDGLSVPVTCGLLRPSILLPSSSSTWDDERARVVLLHELAHVARFDCLVHVVAQAAVALHWVNPLAWIAVARLRYERERACDDLVLAAGTHGPTYAEHLLEIARGAGRKPALAAAALAMARPSELEGRLLAVLDRTLRRGVAGRRAMLIVSLLTVTTVSTMAAVTLTSPDSDGAQAPVVAPAPTPSPAPVPTPRTSPGTGTSAGPVGGVSRGVSGGVQGGVSGGVASGQETARSTGTATPALSSAARENVVQALVAAMKDSSPDVRAQAMQALMQVRSPALFEPMMSALSDSDADVRQQAAMTLGSLGDTRAVPALLKALGDQEPEVRQQAAFALGRLDDGNAAPAIEKLLAADDNAEVRQQAAFALARIGGASSVPVLVAALRDKDAEVRGQAAFALARVGDARAVEPLTQLLKDSEPEVRQQAAFALGRVLGEDGSEGDPSERVKVKISQKEKKPRP